MSDEDPAELFRALEVGDTIRMRMQKDQLKAEVPNRVSPIWEPSATPGGHTTFRGFTKDAAGMWDLESITGAPGNTIVEVVVRRAASEV